MGALLLFTAIAAFQSSDAPQPPAARLMVFLDCTACDTAYVQREIPFVVYVRDRESADVHVLVTSERTGAGGLTFTAAFIGVAARAGQDQTLAVTTRPDSSEDEVRSSLVQTLTLGLLRYLAGTDQASTIRISIADPAAASGAQADRWNHWIFALRGEAALEREESSGEVELEASAAADRITDRWKVSTGVELAYSGEHFELDDDDEVQSVRREQEARVLIVKSLGRHWSAGGRAAIGASTFENTALDVRVSPAVEFNVFPYDQSTRRELRILYEIGPRYARYREPTVFGRLRERRLAHQVSATLDRVETWGSTRAGIEWSQYLHDLSKHRLEGTIDLALRLRRGLALTVQLEGSRIRDQLSLPARGASPEEILLRQRQLASGYELEVALGVTYRFGSMFSAIVNPRFGN